MGTDKFSKFLDMFITGYKKEKRARLISNTCHVPHACRDFDFKNKILDRLNTMDNSEKVEPIINIIIDECKNCIDIIKLIIEYSVMNYDTELREALPDWSVNDFETLYFAIFGQTGAE